MMMPPRKSAYPTQPFLYHFANWMYFTFYYPKLSASERLKVNYQIKNNPEFANLRDD